MNDSFEESLNTSLSLTSRARQLLADIGLKEPAWNPPPGHAEYGALVAFVADHLRQVAAEGLNQAAEIAMTCKARSDAVGTYSVISLTRADIVLAIRARLASLQPEVAKREEGR